MSPNVFRRSLILHVSAVAVLAVACSGDDPPPGCPAPVTASVSGAPPLAPSARGAETPMPSARQAASRVSYLQASTTHVPLSARPYALAINDCGIVYAPRLDAASAARFELPATTPTAQVAVGTIPTDVSFDRAGTRAFVSNQGGSVSVIDVASNSVAQTIPVPDRAFVSLTSPNDDRLYIGSAIGKVYVYSFAAQRFTDSITVGDVPQHLTFHPDGIRLYVSMRDAGRVVEVDTRTNTATRTFNSTYGIQEAVVAPDGSELYVANQSGWLEVWNLGTGARTHQVDLGQGPWAMTLSPDESELYVGLLFEGRIAVVDRTTRVVERYIDVGGTPRRIKFAPDNATIVIANEDGYVTFIK
jgi:YVTN family beta-propeller protein